MWPAITLLVPAWDNGVQSGDVGAITAPADLGEWDDSYVVRLDVPGFTREDIDISVAETTVRIETGLRTAGTLTDAEFLHRERDRRPVEREVELPMGIDEEEVTASVEDGVLTLLLPKDFDGVSG